MILEINKKLILENTLPNMAKGALAGAGLSALAAYGVGHNIQDHNDQVQNVTNDIAEHPSHIIDDGKKLMNLNNEGEKLSTAQDIVKKSFPYTMGGGALIGAALTSDKRKEK